MDVRYYEEARIFGVELIKESDGPVFQLIADELTKVFNIRWTAKLDGFDQRYWDFDYRGVTLSLHLEHFLGISIFVRNPKQILKMQKNLRGNRRPFQDLEPMKMSFITTIQYTFSFIFPSKLLYEKDAYGNLFHLPQTQWARSCPSWRVYL